MAGNISQFLCADHARLDDALRRATADSTRIDHTALCRISRGLTPSHRYGGENPLEEGAGGVYEKCEQALGAEADQVRFG